MFIWLITDMNLTQSDFVLKEHVSSIDVAWTGEKYKALAKRRVAETYFASIKQCFPHGKTGKHWGHTHALELFSWKHITSFCRG